MYFYCLNLEFLILYRNPTSELPHIDWKPHTQNDPCYLRIDESLNVFNEKLFEERLGFWRNWSAKFRR